MKSFLKMSQYAGMREDLVQAGGGNSSYKINEECMAIKASGFQLADIKENEGYALVNPKKIREAFLNDSDLDSMTEEDSKAVLKEAFIKGAHPSIETFLHSVSGRYSLHTHPVVINVLASRAGGMETLGELFPDAILVPYATPGIELAKAYFKEYKRAGKEAGIVFLQNHGLLVSADTAREVIEMTENILKKTERYLNLDFSDYRAVTELSQHFDEGIVWQVTDTHILEAQKILGQTWDSAFCPDCVVFLGKKMFSAPSDGKEEEWAVFKEQYGFPVVISYKDKLYIHAESVKKAMEIQSILSFSAQVMALNQGHERNMLSEQEQNYLLNWDAEKYRKNLKK